MEEVGGSGSSPYLPVKAMVLSSLVLGPVNVTRLGGFRKGTGAGGTGLDGIGRDWTSLVCIMHEFGVHYA